MNNQIKFFAAVLAAFIIGIGVNNYAVSDIVSSGFKVAVIDVPQVVASSAQVLALKKEQQTKAEELITYIEKARKDIAATTDEKKKQSLEEKYNKELQKKRESLEEEYAKKLQAIDKSISNTITEKAKADNYNIVIAKGVILYGGDDITQDIIKIVK